jgi:WD40 repeat protein
MVASINSTDSGSVACIFSVQSGETIQQIHGHTKHINALAIAKFSSGQQFIITGSDDATLQIAEIHPQTGGESVQTLEHDPSNGKVTAVAITGNLMVTGLQTGKVRLWNLGSDEKFARVWPEEGDEGNNYQCHSGAVNHCQFSYGAQWGQPGKLLTCSDDHSIRIWELSASLSFGKKNTVQTVRVLEAHRGSVQCALFYGNNQRIISVGCEGANGSTFVMWNAHRGVPIKQWQVQSRCNFLALRGGQLSDIVFVEGLKTGTSLERTDTVDVAVKYVPMRKKGARKGLFKKSRGHEDNTKSEDQEDLHMTVYGRFNFSSPITVDHCNRLRRPFEDWVQTASEQRLGLDWRPKLIQSEQSDGSSPQIDHVDGVRVKILFELADFDADPTTAIKQVQTMMARIVQRAHRMAFFCQGKEIMIKLIAPEDESIPRVDDHDTSEEEDIDKEESTSMVDVAPSDELQDKRPLLDLATLKGHEGDVMHCCIDMTDENVLSCGKDKRLKKWHILPYTFLSPKNRNTLDIPANENFIGQAEEVLTQCFFSEESTRAITIGTETLEIWNLEQTEGTTPGSSLRAYKFKCAKDATLRAAVSGEIVVINSGTLREADVTVLYDRRGWWQDDGAPTPQGVWVTVSSELPVTGTEIDDNNYGEFFQSSRKLLEKFPHVIFEPDPGDLNRTLLHKAASTKHFSLPLISFIIRCCPKHDKTHNGLTGAGACLRCGKDANGDTPYDLLIRQMAGGQNASPEFSTYRTKDDDGDDDDDAATTTATAAAIQSQNRVKAVKELLQLDYAPYIAKRQPCEFDIDDTTDIGFAQELFASWHPANCVTACPWDLSPQKHSSGVQ